LRRNLANSGGLDIEVGAAQQIECPRIDALRLLDAWHDGVYIQFGKRHIENVGQRTDEDIPGARRRPHKQQRPRRFIVLRVMSECRRDERMLGPVLPVNMLVKAPADDGC